MNHRKPINHRHPSPGRWFLLVATVVLGLVVFVGVIDWLQHRTAVAPTVTQATTPPSIQSKLLFVGDVFWGRRVQTLAEASGQGPSYLTSGLSPSDRAAYDAWIANFECPITSRDVPYQLQVDYLKFNCRPQYLSELAKWFTAVTLANNHMNNNGGQQGLLETRQNLEQQGIQYAGHYDMDQTDDLCEVIALPARLSGPSKSTQLPVALCGYMYVVDATPTDAQLAVMRQYAAVMPVIAMPHMGIEYRATAEAAKVEAYHRMIDAGADIVIGAHPHVIQNSENYKGRLIAYSLGNFLFDQQRFGRSTTLGLGVGVTLTVPGGPASQAYTSLGASCRAYKDTCLQQLQTSLKQRPAIDVSYNFTCYDEASGTPRLGDRATCDDARATATVDQLSSLSKQW